MEKQLLRSAPYFPVVDLEGSATHYEHVFGFNRDYVGGTPPRFAIMSRDGLPVMLRLVDSSERITPNEKQGVPGTRFSGSETRRRCTTSSRTTAPTWCTDRLSSRSTT